MLLAWSSKDVTRKGLELPRTSLLEAKSSLISARGAVIETDAITRKAFGTRFANVATKDDSKSATDDAALERFRKRMRRWPRGHPMELKSALRSMIDEKTRCEDRSPRPGGLVSLI